MSKLSIFVCENFEIEFRQIAELNNYKDVVINSFSCLCENKDKRVESENKIADGLQNNQEGYILCSKFCNAVKMADSYPNLEVYTSNYCFSHLASETFVSYILKKGGYIIGSGWLDKWEEHLELTGFNQETARKFYSEFCKELVFFDSGVDKELLDKLNALSAYLDIPNVVIPYDVTRLEVILENIVCKWRQKNKDTCQDKIQALQAQSAEYATIFDLLSKMASFSNKHDTYAKLKDIYTMVFGARNYQFWSYSNQYKEIPGEVAELFAHKHKNYLLIKEENRFLIKIEFNDELFGIVDVSNFLFPEYLEKYLNFAIDIVKICGLVLYNMNQYDQLIETGKEIKYLSFHDTLTGLFNRTYLNETMSFEKLKEPISVFMFDIDGLKYVNDNFGHNEGDTLILSAGKVLSKCFRETDTVARIGGDEFLVIIQDCDELMAKEMKRRLQEAIKTHNMSINMDHLKLSISSGYALSDETDKNLEGIIQRADKLMYKEKNFKQANKF